MNIGRINAFSATPFKSNKKNSEYENPISRGTERNLAILKSAAGSAVVGAIVYGLTSSFGMKNKQVPMLAAAAGIIATLVITLPAKIYNTNVNAFVKEKEMDVFSRDRALKTNLTEEVGKEVKNPEVSLDKKLDDNLKLQMANRGSALGIANITAQPQG